MDLSTTMSDGRISIGAAAWAHRRTPVNSNLSVGSREDFPPVAVVAAGIAVMDFMILVGPNEKYPATLARNTEVIEPAAMTNGLPATK